MKPLEFDLAPQGDRLRRARPHLARRERPRRQWPGVSGFGGLVDQAVGSRLICQRSLSEISPGRRDTSAGHRSREFRRTKRPNSVGRSEFGALVRNATYEKCVPSAHRPVARTRRCPGELKRNPIATPSIIGAKRTSTLIAKTRLNKRATDMLCSFGRFERTPTNRPLTKAKTKHHSSKTSVTRFHSPCNLILPDPGGSGCRASKPEISAISAGSG